MWKITDKNNIKTFYYNDQIVASASDDIKEIYYHTAMIRHMNAPMEDIDKKYAGYKKINLT